VRRRNLLGNAVDIAATEENLPRRHPHHPAARKYALQPPRGQRVGAWVEERHHDAAVRDIEVDVAAGEALARGACPGAVAGNETARLASAHAQRPRHGQSHDFKAPATRIACSVQPLPGIVRDRVLRVAALVAPGEAHHPRADETREIVDVAVGLVVEHALAEPDDVADAQVVP
jgi:hypothetical protein